MADEFGIKTFVAVWEKDCRFVPGLVIGTGLADSGTWFVLTGAGDNKQTQYIKKEDMAHLGSVEFLYTNRDPAEYLKEDLALNEAFYKLSPSPPVPAA